MREERRRQNRFLYLSAVALLLACAPSTEPAPPASVDGTWTSERLTLVLTQTGLAVSGTGTFRFPDFGSSCTFPVSGSYSAPDLSLDMDNEVTCAGSFSARASGARLSGLLDFDYQVVAALTRESFEGDVRLLLEQGIE